MKNTVQTQSNVINKVIEYLLKEGYIKQELDPGGESGFILNLENKTVKEVHEAENRILGIGSKKDEFDDLFD